MEPLPKLPAHFRNKSNWEPVKLVTRMATGYFIGCAISLITYRAMLEGGSLWLTLALSPVLLASTIFTGLFLIEAAIISHDGGHGALHKNLKTSFFLGILISSLSPFYMGVAYNYGHWPHHKFTNTEQDPQAVWYATSKVGKLPRPLDFLVFGVLIHYYFMLTTWDFIKGRCTIPGFSAEMSKKFALTNVALSAVFTAAWFSLVMVNYPVFFLCFFVPWIWGLAWFSGLTFVEHGNTGQGYRNSRSSSNRVFDWIMSGDNCHLEHHLYPWVQRTKLPEVHRYLRSIGFHDRNDCVVDTGISELFVTMLTSTQPLIQEQEGINWMPDEQDKKTQSA